MPVLEIEITGFASLLNIRLLSECEFFMETSSPWKDFVAKGVQYQLTQKIEVKQLERISNHTEDGVVLTQ
jgi:hypothetical protein